MKLCPVCRHPFHVPGACSGSSQLSGKCLCRWPSAITTADANKMLTRRSQRRAADRMGKNWENELITKARKRGYLVHHVERVKTKNGWRTPIAGDPGFPDTVFAHPERPDFFLVEKKAGDGRVRPEQRAWHAAITLGGGTVYVWRPEDREAIERRLEGPL